MSIEKMKEVWAGQSGVSIPMVDEQQLLQRVRHDGRAFDRRIRRRDTYEILACLLLVVWWALPNKGALGPAWAYWAALGMLAALTLAFVGMRVQLANRRKKYADSLTGEVEWSLHHTRYQVRLLTRVLWWYLLPLFVAGHFHVLHRRGTFTAADWPVVLLVGLCFAVVYWLNQRAVRTRLGPQLERLTEIQAQWQSAGSGEKTPQS